MANPFGLMDPFDIDQADAIMSFCSEDSNQDIPLKFQLKTQSAKTKDDMEEEEFGADAYGTLGPDLATIGHQFDELEVA